MVEQALTVCLGMGVDSSAMLIEMHKRGIRPTSITFADVGSERPDTYSFIPIFRQWLKDVDFPDVTICTYEPQEATSARYRDAVVDVTTRLGIQLTELELTRLSRIYGNMVANSTLPGIAFARKSCSIKWKLQAQEPPRIQHPAHLATWHSGQKVIKAIGFDAGETHRTFATGEGVNIGSMAGIPKFSQRYDVRYYLREWGYHRPDLAKIISDAGLPVPPKSACFFCPSAKNWEVASLRQDYPHLYELALEMERLYQAGSHFRGFDTWSVTAKNKQTKEVIKWQVPATNIGEARGSARATLDDTQRPFKWTIGCTQSIVGLHRTKSWLEQASEKLVVLNG